MASFEAMTDAPLHFRFFELKKALISDNYFLELHNCYFELGGDLGQVLCTANTINSLSKTLVLQSVFGSYSASPDLEARKYPLE